MKFPIMCCIDITNFSVHLIETIINKMIGEGYQRPSNCQDYPKDYRYIGVNQNGSILFYDNNLHYIDIDTEPFFNVISCIKVREYLLNKEEDNNDLEL